MSITTEPAPDRARSVGSKLLVALVAVIAVLQVWQTYLQVSAPRMQQWEYNVEAPTDERLGECLSNLGVMGWEVVSARRATSEAGGLFDRKVTASYEMIVRRPLGRDVSRIPTPKDYGCRKPVEPGR